MAIGLPLLVVVVASLGAPIGSFIGSFTKSEIRHGWANIRVCYHVLVAITVYLVMSQYTSIGWLPVAAALLVGGTLAYVESRNHNKPSVWVMALLGVALASMIGYPLLPIVASVAFMAGVAIGSLVHGRWRLVAAYAIVELLVFFLVFFAV